MATGAITQDNSIAELFAGGTIVKALTSGLRFVGAPLVLRAGGQSTFKIGILKTSTKFMIRFEKHSIPKIGGGRGYPVHFNIEKLGMYNKHIFPNPANWGKFKVK